jgi:threonine dehydrogenase-like Zn-dependent dehydrogenase
MFDQVGVQRIPTLTKEWLLVSRGISLSGGHEGVGHVVATGELTTGSSVRICGRVGVKWIANVCAQCEVCRRGPSHVSIFANIQIRYTAHDVVLVSCLVNFFSGGPFLGYTNDGKFQ